jgi:acetolactate synthase-1/2/3 large subunit
MRCKGTQEAPTVEMVKPITKLAIMATDPADFPGVLNLLIDEAKRDKPGGVWLDVPLDVQGMSYE